MQSSTTPDEHFTTHLNNISYKIKPQKKYARLENDDIVIKNEEIKSLADTFKSITESLENTNNLDRMVKNIKTVNNLEKFNENSLDPDKLDKLRPSQKSEVKKIINSFNKTSNNDSSYENKLKAPSLKPLSDYRIEKLNKFLPWEKAKDKNPNSIRITFNRGGRNESQDSNVLNLRYFISKSWIENNNKRNNDHYFLSKSFVSNRTPQRSPESSDKLKLEFMHMKDACVAKQKESFLSRHTNCNPDNKLVDPNNLQSIINDLGKVVFRLEDIKVPLTYMPKQINFEANPYFDTMKSQYPHEDRNILRGNTNLAIKNGDNIQDSVKNKINRINRLNNSEKVKNINKTDPARDIESSNKVLSKSKKIPIGKITSLGKNSGNQNVKSSTANNIIKISDTKIDKSEAERVLQIFEPDEFEARMCKGVKDIKDKIDKSRFKSETVLNKCKRKVKFYDQFTDSDNSAKLELETKLSQIIENSSDDNLGIKNEIKKFLEDLRNIFTAPVKEVELFRQLQKAQKNKFKAQSDNMKITDPKEIGQLISDMHVLVSKAYLLDNPYCHQTKSVDIKEQVKPNGSIPKINSLTELTGFKEAVENNDKNSDT